MKNGTEQPESPAPVEAEQKSPTEEVQPEEFKKPGVRVLVGNSDDWAEFTVVQEEMALVSTSLEASIFGPHQPSNEPRRLPDVNPRGFSVLMGFVETGHLAVNNVLELEEAWELAQKFQISSMSDLCRPIWKLFLTPDTVCRTVRVLEKWEEEFLRTDCEEVITNETNLVIDSADFKHSTIGFLQRLVQSNRVSLKTEGQLFAALITWGKEECARQGKKGTPDDLRSTVGPLVPYIRFLDMEPDEFVRLVVTEQILSESEERAILVNMQMPLEIVPMPDTVSSNRHCRLLCKRSFVTTATICSSPSPHPPEDPGEGSSTASHRENARGFFTAGAATKQTYLVPDGSEFNIVIEVLSGILQIESLDIPLYNEVKRDPMTVRVTATIDRPRSGWRNSIAFNATVDQMMRYVNCEGLQVRAGESVSIVVECLQDYRSLIKFVPINLPYQTRLNDTEFIVKENGGVGHLCIRRVYMLFK